MIVQDSQLKFTSSHLTVMRKLGNISSKSVKLKANKKAAFSLKGRDPS